MVVFKDAELIEVVLEQNEALRRRFGGFTAETADAYRRLWRCPICFDRTCADRERCREMLRAYGRQKWDRAIEDATGKRLDDAIPY